VSRFDNNSDLSELQNEYEERFDMILREIDSIKEIVIKLQAYTMDNKILVEEHTANKIILERRSFTTSSEQVDHTRAIMDMVANNTERLNEPNVQRITDRTTNHRVKRTYFNHREHSTKINSFNQSAHKIQIDTPWR
jgi:hypothetical protein